MEVFASTACSQNSTNRFNPSICGSVCWHCTYHAHEQRPAAAQLGGGMAEAGIAARKRGLAAGSHGGTCGLHFSSHSPRSFDGMAGCADRTLAELGRCTPAHSLELKNTTAATFHMKFAPMRHAQRLGVGHPLPAVDIRCTVLSTSAAWSFRQPAGLFAELCVLRTECTGKVGTCRLQPRVPLELCKAPVRTL